MNAPGPSASCHPAPPAPGVARRAGLAVSYEGGDRELLDCVLERVDYLELPPEAMSVVEDGRLRIPRRTLDELAGLAGETSFIVHGIGLSLGSAGGMNDEYLERVDQLVERLDVRWHSEHLGLVTVDGESLGTMLPVARTEEALELVCERIDAIQRRYGLPFLVENVARMLPEPHADYSEAAFLNELVARTGCGLLLDVYNLQCDEHNFGFDLAAFLEEVNLDAVGELHIAGGVVEHGMCLDVHSRPAMDSTLELVSDVLARTPNAGAVTYEFLGQAIPVLGAPAVGAEVDRLRAAMAAR